VADEPTGDVGERDYPPILDAAQVARLLSLSIDKVRKMSRDGEIPAHRIPGGRTFRYLKDEIIEWVRAQPAHVPDEREAPAERR
jgi:excisionase family DNA binding protein